MKLSKLILLVAGLGIFTACQNGAETGEGTTQAKAAPTSEDITKVAGESNHTQHGDVTGKTYEIGEQVPHDQVCMVNDAYMGRLQLEVPFEGEMYYGCCEMCVKRIPNDPAVRVAMDPFSQKEVNKARAYIVLTGARGEVEYFENEENYKEFLKSRQGA